jgi:hypothetical protein
MTGEGLAIFMGGAKTFASLRASAAQSKAIREQMLQERMKADQEALARTDKMKRLFGTTEAMGGARGFSIASPSFKAIEDEDFNQYAQEQKIGDINEQLQEDALRQQAQNIDNQAFLGVGTNLFELGQMTSRSPNLLSGTAQSSQNMFNPRASKGSLFSWWDYPNTQRDQTENNYLW